MSIPPVIPAKAGIHSLNFLMMVFQSTFLGAIRDFRLTYNGQVQEQGFKILAGIAIAKTNGFGSSFLQSEAGKPQ